MRRCWEAKSISRPWNESVTVKVADRDSALTACFHTRFELADEIYQFKNLNPDMHTLLKLDATNANREKKEGKDFFERGSREDKDYVLAWTRNFGKGRVFYTSLGQLNEVWKNEKFQQHILLGSEWALDLISAERMRK